MPFTGHTVVVTHHDPSLAYQHPSFPLSTTSAGLNSNLDNLISQADLWIYGHTHSNLDKVVEGTRLISNQPGYPRSISPGFDIEKTVSLERYALK